MDFFTKNKMLFWCVVVLVMLNIVTLGSFWLRKPPLGPLGRPGQRADGQKIMEEQLGLSDEQAARVEQLRNEHFMRARPLQDEMHKIRLDLLNEIFKDEPDKTKIQDMFTQLGDDQVRFEKNLYRHFQELKDVCNPQQMHELKIMLRDLIERTRPRDPEPRPRGPQGSRPEDRLPPPPPLPQ